MEGLGAALLFKSHWGCSLLHAAVREKKEGGRRKREEKEGEREKKRKGRKRKKNKKYGKLSKQEKFQEEK
jgi:hypothetical protein